MATKGQSNRHEACQVRLWGGSQGQPTFNALHLARSCCLSNASMDHGLKTQWVETSLLDPPLSPPRPSPSPPHRPSLAPSQIPCRIVSPATGLIGVSLSSSFTVSPRISRKHLYNMAAALRATHQVFELTYLCMRCF